jgi:hypothetical protein
VRLSHGYRHVQFSATHIDSHGSDELVALTTRHRYVPNTLLEAEWFGDNQAVLISPSLKWANLAQMMLGLLDTLQVRARGAPKAPQHTLRVWCQP